MAHWWRRGDERFVWTDEAPSALETPDVTPPGRPADPGSVLRRYLWVLLERAGAPVTPAIANDLDALAAALTGAAGAPREIESMLEMIHTLTEISKEHLLLVRRIQENMVFLLERVEQLETRGRPAPRGPAGGDALMATARCLFCGADALEADHFEHCDGRQGARRGEGRDADLLAGRSRRDGFDRRRDGSAVGKTAGADPSSALHCRGVDPCGAGSHNA